MSFKVLGSPNHAVGVVVVSVAWVFLVDRAVAHFCTVGADPPSQLPVPGPVRMSGPYFINCKNQNS